MVTKTRIAALTELIFDKLSSIEYHPIDWRTAILINLKSTSLENDGLLKSVIFRKRNWNFTTLFATS